MDRGRPVSNSPEIHIGEGGGGEGSARSKRDTTIGREDASEGEGTGRGHEVRAGIADIGEDIGIGIESACQGMGTDGIGRGIEGDAAVGGDGPRSGHGPTSGHCKISETHQIGPRSRAAEDSIPARTNIDSCTSEAGTINHIPIFTPLTAQVPAAQFVNAGSTETPLIVRVAAPEAALTVGLTRIPLLVAVTADVVASVKARFTRLPVSPAVCA